MYGCMGVNVGMPHDRNELLWNRCMLPLNSNLPHLVFAAEKAQNEWCMVSALD